MARKRPLTKCTYIDSGCETFLVLLGAHLLETITCSATRPVHYKMQHKRLQHVERVRVSLRKILFGNVVELQTGTQARVNRRLRESARRACRQHQVQRRLISSSQTHRETGGPCNTSSFVDTFYGFYFSHDSDVPKDRITFHDSKAVNEHITAIGVQLQFVPANAPWVSLVR